MRVLLWIVLLAGLAYGGYRLWGGGAPAPEGPGKAPPVAPEPTLGGRPLSEFYLEHDRFLPATDPKTVRADAAHWLLPDDEVFGVVVRGQARAYPVPMISYHHVVNDVIQGIPIAITY